MPPPDEPSPYREGEPERVPRDQPRRRRPRDDDEEDEPQDIGANAGMRMLLPVGRSPWAIIAGYLGLLSVLCVPAPFALLTAIIAIIDIQKSKGKKHGMGRAVFGLIMGVLGTLFLGFALLGLIFGSRR